MPFFDEKSRNAFCQKAISRRGESKLDFEKASSKGFTLIEVTIAVMIISVVIASLLKLFSTNTHHFGTLERKVELSTAGTLLLGVADIGFESRRIHLDDLLKDFQLDDDLRRTLKSINAEVIYQEVKRLDSADFLEETEELAKEEGKDIVNQSAGAASLEIGRTGLQIDDEQTTFLRLRLQ